MPASSYLTKSQFATMSSMFLPKQLTKSEILNKIFEEIDDNQDNFVSVGEFEYLFERNSRECFDVNLGKLRIEILDDVTKRRVHMRDVFQQIITQQRYRKRPDPSIKMLPGTYWMPQDLTRCLTSYNIEISEENETEMFRLLDVNNDGLISYDEFKVGILGTPSNGRQLAKTLRRIIKKDQLDIKKVFKNIDGNRSEKIDFTEFAKFTDELRLNFSYKDMIALFDLTDLDVSGEITAEEMIQMMDPGKVTQQRDANIMVVLKEDLEKDPTWPQKWNKVDSSNLGCTPTKLVRFLQELNSRLEKFEAYQVFEKLDFRGKGVLLEEDIGDFLNDSRRKGAVGQDNIEGGKSYGQNQDNLQELRQAFDYKNLDGYDLFKKMDLNNNGFMSKRNIQHILSINKILQNDPQVIRQLCSYYQEGNSDIIDYRKIFEDMAKLRPAQPIFAQFLASDILASVKKRKQNLKEFFLGVESKAGNVDGKMSISEFGIMVSSVWGEGGVTTLEKATLKPRPGEKAKEKSFIRR